MILVLEINTQFFTQLSSEAGFFFAISQSQMPENRNPDALKLLLLLLLTKDNRLKNTVLPIGKRKRKITRTRK